MTLSGQDDSGLKRLLTNSRLYNLFQENLLGSKQARKWLANNVWKLRGGETVVDIGCGPGTVLEYLPPNISYWGIDVSENYIHAARKRFSARGSFFVGTAQDFVDRDDRILPAADLVLCNALLHHLSDPEAIQVLKLSKQLMKQNGRLVCIEAAFLARQTRLSKWIVGADRGKHVRSEQEWKNLFATVFDSYSTSIITGLIRIPYTHIVIECVNNQPPGERTNS